MENELWRYPVCSAPDPKLIVMSDERDEKIDDNRHVILHLADVKKGISKNCMCKECAEYGLRKTSTDFLKYCDERDQFFKELVDNVEGVSSRDKLKKLKRNIAKPRTLYMHLLEEPR